MARDFSNPKKLGFMRLVQVLFAFNIGLTLMLSVFLIKGTYTLGFVDVLDYVNLIFDAMAFWLIWQRKRAARAFIIAFALFNIVSGSIVNMAAGSFSVGDQIGLSLIDIILVLYFATSRRAKAVLTEPFTAAVKRDELTREESYYQPRTWAFWRNLIMHFCVFSVVGHWLEAAYCTLIRFGILPGIYDPNSQIWSDWLYPFMVYGVGAVACVLLLYPVKNLLEEKLPSRVLPLIVSFVLNALVCTLIELVMGLIMNQPLPDGTMPLWDYRDMAFNFMGQVCLQNAVAFGIAATLMVWVIYPACEAGMRRLPKDAGNVAFVGICVGFAILIFLYYINIVLPDLEMHAENENASVSLQISERDEGDAPVTLRIEGGDEGSGDAA